MACFVPVCRGEFRPRRPGILPKDVLPERKRAQRGFLDSAFTKHFDSGIFLHTFKSRGVSAENVRLNRNFPRQDMPATLPQISSRGLGGSHFNTGQGPRGMFADKWFMVARRFLQTGQC